MDERTEAKFEQIAADAIARAESVDCDVEDFVEGMRNIYLSVRERYEEACSEHGIDPIHPSM